MKAYCLPDITIMIRGDLPIYFARGKMSQFVALNSIGFSFHPFTSAPDGFLYDADIRAWPRGAQVPHRSVLQDTILTGEHDERIFFHSHGDTFKVSMHSEYAPANLNVAGWQDIT